MNSPISTCVEACGPKMRSGSSQLCACPLRGTNCSGETPRKGLGGGSASFDPAMGETSFLQILLMIVFRRIELRRGIDLRHNRPLIFAVPLQFLLRGFRSGLLFRSKEKHGGSILRPNVRTLPVQCRGVMVLPKNFEQLLIGNF